MADFMKKTCSLCPYSRTKTLHLHPSRARDFAYMAQNRYNDFPCHKTAEHREETDDESGGYVAGERSKSCHGFLTLQSAENGNAPKGFIPDGDGFEDTDEMIETHQQIWEDHQMQLKDHIASRMAPEALP